MDILIGERSSKLEYRYLRSADQEKVTHGAADDDLFPIEVEDTCLIALATAYNARETEGGITKQELFNFVEECFHLKADKMKQLKERVQTSDKPELYLKCRVLRASGLTAKDVHDPYCHIGVLNEMHREKSIVKHKDLEQWNKEGLVESVASTTVRRDTSEPEWNELFDISVAEPSKEMLVLEVWNDNESSEQGGAHGKSKGFRGIGLRKKGDGFIGRLFHPLRSIPDAGQEKTLVIYDRSRKKEHGSVTLWLSVGAKEKKIPLEARLSDYAALTRFLVSFSAKKDGSYVRRWSGELPSKAEKLLEHHALLNNVSALQQACIRLSPLIKYHKLYTINIKAICDLIHKVKECHREFSSTSPSQEWKKQLFADLNELSEEIQGVLRNHLTIINISSSLGVAKIKERVTALCELYSFRPFTEQLPPGNSSLNTLKGTLEKCIRVAVSQWFRALDAQLQPQVDTEAERLAALVSLSEHCLDQCQRTFKFLNPIFKEAGVDYFSSFFASLDKLLCTVAESRLAKYKRSSVSSTFAVYCSFKGIADMLKHVDKSMYQDLTMPHYHTFFKEMVENWIKIATDKCKDYTVKAIAADSEITVTNDVMFSSSALDTTGFLLQVATFWKRLEWPVASQAYAYACSVVMAISDCALFYVGEVFKKLKHDDMFDENGKFRATEKVCVILNNMQHIRQELSQFEQKLELQSFYKWLEAEEKLGESFKKVVESLSVSSDEDIYNKMDQVMLEITEKVYQLSPDIQEFVHGIISKEGEIKDEEVTDPLLEYLHRNLQTFVKHLYPAVLKIILNHMWRVSVDSVDKYLQEASVGRDSFLQGPFATQKSIGGVSPKAGRKGMKITPGKKSSKSAAPLHTRLFSALKSLGDTSDDQGAHVEFHEKFISSIKSMGEAWMDSMDHCYDEISEGLSLNPNKVINSVQLHQRLFATLKTMRDFYHCGGNGLDDVILDSDRYKTLYSKLDILRLPTDKLILRFFSDLARRQRKEVERGRAELGTLLISVGYLKQSSVVDVDVIQGKSLPGLDKSNVKYLINSGLSDPFVQLTMMPSWAFAYDSSKQIKTGVKKRTPDPFFNETFKLPAKQKEVDIEGTALLLTVFDYNIIGANEFVGMCVVACKDIPQLASPEASLTDPAADVAQQVNLTLPLFRYTTETPVFAELDARAGLGDEKANDFFKTNKYLNLLGDLHQIRRYASVLDSMSLPPMKKPDLSCLKLT